jgi:hypothetical protein
LKAIEDVTGYATVKHLSSKQILDIAFPFPPLPEQKRIVGILDEASEGIATAKANAEKNLQNARALFESHLQSVFMQLHEKGDERLSSVKSPARSITLAADLASSQHNEMVRLNAGYVTKTGGREATLRHIPGKLSLAVGMPSIGSRRGWRWTTLTDLARLESGH